MDYLKKTYHWATTNWHPQTEHDAEHKEVHPNPGKPHKDTFEGRQVVDKSHDDVKITAEKGKLPLKVISDYMDKVTPEIEAKRAEVKHLKEQMNEFKQGFMEFYEALGKKPDQPPWEKEKFGNVFDWLVSLKTKKVMVDKNFNPNSAPKTDDAAFSQALVKLGLKADEISDVSKRIAGYVDLLNQANTKQKEVDDTFK